MPPGSPARSGLAARCPGRSRRATSTPRGHPARRGPAPCGFAGELLRHRVDAPQDAELPVQALADGLERGSGRLGRGRSREDADELFPGGRAPLRRRRVAAVPNGAEGLELPVDLNRLRREVCDPKVAGPSTEPGWNVGDRSSESSMCRATAGDGGPTRMTSWGCSSPWASQRPSAAAIASHTSRAAVVVVGAGRWAADSPRRVPCPSSGSAPRARSAPTSAPAGTQPPGPGSQLLRAHATLAPAGAPMAAPAITAAAPLQPMEWVSGVGREG